jgi:hypothetical protein
MKLKITRTAVIIGMIVLLIGMIFLGFWLFDDYTHIFNDKVIGRDSYHAGESNYGWIHMSINLLMVFSYIVWLIFFIWEISEDRGKRAFEWLYDKNASLYNTKYETDEVKPITFRWKRWIWIAIIIFVLFQIFKFGKTIYNQSVFMYNTSKLYHNTYQQKVEEKMGFYDKLWKTYLQKEKITNINKETFIQVTKLIMENRRDGQQLTWKWLQENQQIPYEQFTVFYADLSDFITSQREGYFSIEKACQVIANKNNTLLDTFPNNIYNRFLKQDKIKFEYGFLSDSTNNVFKTKVENLK